MVLFICFFVIPGLAFCFAFYSIGYYTIGTPLWLCLIGGGLFSVLLNIVIASKGNTQLTLKERYTLILKKYSRTKTDKIILYSISSSCFFVLLYVLNQYHATKELYNPYLYLVSTIIIS